MTQCPFTLSNRSSKPLQEGSAMRLPGRYYSLHHDCTSRHVSAMWIPGRHYSRHHACTSRPCISHVASWEILPTAARLHITTMISHVASWVLLPTAPRVHIRPWSAMWLPRCYTHDTTMPAIHSFNRPHCYWESFRSSNHESRQGLGNSKWRAERMMACDHWGIRFKQYNWIASRSLFRGTQTSWPSFRRWAVCAVATIRFLEARLHVSKRSPPRTTFSHVEAPIGESLLPTANRRLPRGNSCSHRHQLSSVWIGPSTNHCNR